ncbi:SUN domain-containing protein 3-like [Patagioenas fasciata]|uniref:SUN domain-containing protein 3-like n=1 Tax=Patagioenas fasciata TaxID=372321 RepID=UPI003A999DCB
MTLMLHKLQEQLYHLRWSTKDVAERALQEGLKQAKLPGFTGRVVQEIISQALEKLEKIQVPMDDYALKSAGAVTLYIQTSSKPHPVQIDKMGIGTCPGHPGNCWPFPGSQGHVFIKLSMPLIPRAVTMDHVSGTVFHGESISGAPKDFAVYGFKEEHEEQGMFLGQFTFLTRLQVLSNWGHPDYTCLYRFRVHGDPPKDGGDTAVSSVNKFH